MMGSEDFADMLHQVPGAYFFLGMTPGASLHNAGLHLRRRDPAGRRLAARRIAERRTAAVATRR